MNGSRSPAAATRSGDTGDADDHAPLPTNTHQSPPTGVENSHSSPVPSIEGATNDLPDAPSTNTTAPNAVVNGADEDAASEAETLIESPVKKREADKRQASAAVKAEKPQKSRIGSLPVPQDDDDDGESAASPRQSTEVGAKTTSNRDAKNEDVEMMDDEDDDEGSEALSSADSSPSRTSSRSRAASENQDDTRNGTASPNPRKRKHRASSVDLLSSKRRSMDPPARRKLRGMHSEDNTTGKTPRSPSPTSRGHRRVQSALDGTIEGSTRKRRGSQFPVREPKSAKSLEESDASSETTSRGQEEFKRPQRGIGRSTSTPGGRAVGREHKRHVNKYGFTRLAEACEEGDVALVKEWREKDPDQLELAEFAGNKPLQIAALNGNADVVAYLIKEGAQTDCANVDKDTPLIDAAENGHLEVVKLLLDAGVDPLRQNLKGQQALDVVTDENEEAKNIRAALHSAIDTWNSSEAKQRREEEEENRHRAGPSKELHFMARTYENLLKLVQNNDRNGVQEFLAARVPVDNAIIAAAGKTGDLYLVNMLLAEMSEKKLFQKPEKPLLSVLGTSHFEILKMLTGMDQFNPGWRSRQGKTWPELAEERAGPMWRQEKELLTRLREKSGGEDGAGKEGRRSSSPAVSKREIGRRKLLSQRTQDEDEGESEEEDDEETGEMGRPQASGRKKNGRRLMSRKALRTAKGGALSDSDEGSSEDAPGEDMVQEGNEETMKPPETPHMGRRLRSKSQSGSPEVSPKMLRKKRSSSFRSSGPPSSEVKGLGLQTVNEEGKDGSGIEVKSSSASSANEKARKERVEEAKAALDLAKKAEEKRREDEAAEAEAKRVEDEAKKKAEEEAAERRAEEERKAEEVRREEAVRAEQLRREAEEARLQRERELEEERRRYRSAVLDALPKSLAPVLNPTSDFKFEGLSEKSWIVEHFTPLRVLHSDADGQDWVLNLQAAALMGKSGLELFFGSECPYFDSSLASQWTTAELEIGDWRDIDQILTAIPLRAPPDDEEDENEHSSWEEDQKKAAERWNANVEARRLLREEGCKAVIRRVRLADVMAHLHPLLRGTSLEVEFAPSVNSGRRVKIVQELEASGTKGFVGRMKAFWDGTAPFQKIGGGASKAGSSALGEVRRACDGMTDVTVVHEK